MDKDDLQNAKHLAIAIVIGLALAGTVGLISHVAQQSGNNQGQSWSALPYIDLALRAVATFFTGWILLLNCESGGHIGCEYAPNIKFMYIVILGPAATIWLLVKITGPLRARWAERRRLEKLVEAQMIKHPANNVVYMEGDSAVREFADYMARVRGYDDRMRDLFHRMPPAEQDRLRAKYDERLRDVNRMNELVDKQREVMEGEIRLAYGLVRREATRRVRDE